MEKSRKHDFYNRHLYSQGQKKKNIYKNAKKIEKMFHKNVFQGANLSAHLKSASSPFVKLI